MINQRLFQHDPIKSKYKSSFNFYISEKLRGDSKSTGPTCGTSILPQGFFKLCPFADAVAVLHSEEYGDCSSNGIFSSEADIIRSFIHEAGHAVLGVADEYDDAPNCKCTTYRPPNSYNVYIGEAACQKDAQSNGVKGTLCFKFTTCQGGRWKIRENKSFIMDDGVNFANGWSLPSQWRIKDYHDNIAVGLGKPPGALESESTSRSIVMEITVKDDEIVLQDNPVFVASAAPQYLLPPYEYSIKAYNSSGQLLGEYGFNDPRRFTAESDYGGPFNVTEANKTVVIPYFSSISSVTISEGKTSLEVDLSSLSGLLSSRGSIHVNQRFQCRERTLALIRTVHHSKNTTRHCREQLLSAHTGKVANNPVA
jgi:hypothetical protein